MKKLVSFIAVLMTMLLLSACGNKKISTEFKAANAKEQDFHTMCLEHYDVEWEEDYGLYIYTGEGEGIPYVLIYRNPGEGKTEEQFLAEYVVPVVTEYYGEDLHSISEIKDLTYGDKTVKGIEFEYEVDDTELQSVIAVMEHGDDIINFTAKFVKDEDEVTMEALSQAIQNFADGIIEDHSEEESVAEVVNKVKGIVTNQNE